LAGIGPCHRIWLKKKKKKKKKGKKKKKCVEKRGEGKGRQKEDPKGEGGKNGRFPISGFLGRNNPRKNLLKKKKKKKN